MKKPLLPVAAALVLALCGCSHASYSVNGTQTGGGTVTTSQVHVSSGSVFGAALIVGVMLADGIHYYAVEPNGSKTPLDYVPEPDPTRRINAQDCTRPVDPSAGNLMCR